MMHTFSGQYAKRIESSLLSYKRRDATRRDSNVLWAFNTVRVSQRTDVDIPKLLPTASRILLPTPPAHDD